MTWEFSEYEQYVLSSLQLEQALKGHKVTLILQVAIKQPSPLEIFITQAQVGKGSITESLLLE